MTKREAINILLHHKEAFEISGKTAEAIDLVISELDALEKQERETQEKPFPLVVGQLAEIFCNGKWEKGKIVEGYRFNDGVVTVEVEDGRRFWCGQDRTDLYRPYQEDKA